MPTAGDQVIRVGAFDGASLGDFVIQVERITIGDDADSAIVGIGSPVTAHLDFPTDVDAFEFTGQIGQTVTIRVDGDIGVDVYAQLIDPVGDLIASDDDSGHGLDAEISLTLTTAGSHRVEVWGALNLEGQRQLIGSYSVLVQDGPPTAPLEGDTASDTAGVALTFLDALRQGDSATLLALAGPEALTTWGWETTRRCRARPAQNAIDRPRIRRPPDHLTNRRAQRSTQPRLHPALRSRLAALRTRLDRRPVDR